MTLGYSGCICRALEEGVAVLIVQYTSNVIALYRDYRFKIQAGLMDLFQDPRPRPSDISQAAVLLLYATVVVSIYRLVASIYRLVVSIYRLVEITHLSYLPPLTLSALYTASL